MFTQYHNLAVLDVLMHMHEPTSKLISTIGVLSARLNIGLGMIIWNGRGAVFKFKAMLYYTNISC